MMMMMMMEEVVQEDHQNQVMGSKDISQIIKGKRTKRQRPLSPLALTMAVSTSSAEAITSNYSSPTTSTNYGFTEISTSTTTTTTTEEEEDMANCLILLAQGHLTPRKKPNTQKVLFQSEKPAENNISAIGNHNKSGSAITSTGLFVYQCKTCDRCFSSFQALGGHRASHKKPKVNPDGNNNNKKGLLSSIEEENIIGHRSFDNQNSTSTDLSLQISNRIGSSNSSKTIAINKPKVHECSICGAEFTSGQALGGHMRRHRSFMNTQTTATTTTSLSLSLVSSSPESHELKKSKNVMQLDLNLPAPEDDRRENKFPLAGKEQVIVFSHASPLVDCHY